MSDSLTSLPVSRNVSVSVVLSPPAPQAENIDTCLVLGPSNVIDTTERMREYAGITAVGGDFPSTSPEYLTAQAWFEQDPQPISINIGRWAQTATNAQLIGAPLSASQQLLANFTAVTAPGFYAVMDGIPYNVAPASLATATNLPGVAAIIQTALASAVGSSTFVWNAVYSTFAATVGGTAGTSSTISFFAPPTALGNATFAGQPAANDTLSIAGTAITFVSSGPTGNEVLIGANLSATLSALLTFLDGSTDANLVKCTYILAGDVLYIVAAAPGAAGDSLTLAKSSSEITLSGATLTGGGTTDISGLLGMRSTSSGAYAAQGVAAESCLSAVQLMDEMFANQWYGLVTPTATDADTEAVAAYIEADSTRHYYGVTTQEAGVLVSTSTTDIAYVLAQAKYNHTGVQFSSTSPYAIASYLARILTVNWEGSDTTITLKFKQEPGIVAESLGTTQANAAEAKNCNLYVSYSDNTQIIEQGVSSSGQFTDTIVGLDWLAIQLQNDIYTYMYESQTKVPDTDSGNHELTTVITNRLEVAVGNGLIAPGVWNAGGFGTLKKGDYMKTGYYVFQPSVASLSVSDISARQSVPFQIAVNLAGAIHSVSATIYVNP